MPIEAASDFEFSLEAPARVRLGALAILILLGGALLLDQAIEIFSPRYDLLKGWVWVFVICSALAQFRYSVSLDLARRQVIRTLRWVVPLWVAREPVAAYQRVRLETSIDNRQRRMVVNYVVQLEAGRGQKKKTRMLAIYDEWPAAHEAARKAARLTGLRLEATPSLNPTHS